jgi:hypothetical protein
MKPEVHKCEWCAQVCSTSNHLKQHMAPCKRKPVATARPLTEFFKTISKPLLAQVVNEPAGGLERPNKRARPVDDAEEAPSVLPTPPPRNFNVLGTVLLMTLPAGILTGFKMQWTRTLPWESTGITYRPSIVYVMFFKRIRAAVIVKPCQSTRKCHGWWSERRNLEPVV